MVRWDDRCGGDGSVAMMAATLRTSASPSHTQHAPRGHQKSMVCRTTSSLRWLRSVCGHFLGDLSCLHLALLLLAHVSRWPLSNPMQHSTLLAESGRDIESDVSLAVGRRGILLRLGALASECRR